MDTLDDFRGIALALRDLCEMSGGQEIALTFNDGAELCYSASDGCQLLPPERGLPIALTEWIDYAGMVVA